MVSQPPCPNATKSRRLDERGPTLTPVSEHPVAAEHGPRTRGPRQPSATPRTIDAKKLFQTPSRIASPRHPVFSRMDSGETRGGVRNSDAPPANCVAVGSPIPSDRSTRRRSARISPQTHQIEPDQRPPQAEELFRPPSRQGCIEARIRRRYKAFYPAPPALQALSTDSRRQPIVGRARWRGKAAARLRTKSRRGWVICQRITVFPWHWPLCVGPVWDRMRGAPRRLIASRTRSTIIARRLRALSSLSIRILQFSSS
jgi:hypothetical protein